MASCVMDLTEILPDCPVCLERLKEDVVVLSCGHSICLNCNTRFAETEINVEVEEDLEPDVPLSCPICRNDSVSFFSAPTNFGLSKLINGTVSIVESMKITIQQKESQLAQTNDQLITKETRLNTLHEIVEAQRTMVRAKSEHVASLQRRVQQLERENAELNSAAASASRFRTSLRHFLIANDSSAPPPIVGDIPPPNVNVTDMPALEANAAPPPPRFGGRGFGFNAFIRRD